MNTTGSALAARVCRSLLLLEKSLRWFDIKGVRVWARTCDGEGYPSSAEPARPANMHDDWLDDGADDTAGDAEWHRLERNFGALGFQDGVGIGIENAVQGGFDEGFLQASREGMAEGELYGIVR